jgi:hypothetical protein
VALNSTPLPSKKKYHGHGLSTHPKQYPHHPHMLKPFLKVHFLFPEKFCAKSAFPKKETTKRFNDFSWKDLHAFRKFVI